MKHQSFMEQIKMEERPDAPPLEPAGKVGEDFCQLCGEKTKFAGGTDYDLEEYICTKCGAVHVMRIADEHYKGGVPRKLVLESII